MSSSVAGRIQWLTGEEESSVKSTKAMETFADVSSTKTFTQDENNYELQILHCKLKRSVSAPKCQMSSTAPRANSAHHGATLNI